MNICELILSSFELSIDFRELLLITLQLSVDLCKLVFASFQLVFQVGIGEFKVHMS